MASSRDKEPSKRAREKESSKKDRRDDDRKGRKSERSPEKSSKSKPKVEEKSRHEKADKARNGKEDKKTKPSGENGKSSKAENGKSSKVKDATKSSKEAMPQKEVEKIDDKKGEKRKIVETVEPHKEKPAPVAEDFPDDGGFTVVQGAVEEEAPKASKKQRGGAAKAEAGSDSDAGCRSSSKGSSDSESDSAARRREKLRDTQASGFSFAASAGGMPPPISMPGGYGPAPAPGALVPLTPQLANILGNSGNLAMEAARLKMAAEARSGRPGGEKARQENMKSEEAETVIKMQPRLHEALLHADNREQFLKRTGLMSGYVNEDGLVVLRAHSAKALQKALGQLRRVAYHCQWGCGVPKVTALLADRPAKPPHAVVVRLAATSSRLQSFEARLTTKVRKLRIGTQVGACAMVVEGIPGLSRRHCTITFEPEKGAVYVQDLSTNGSYFNGKRLPRPPYKNPQDARVRVFHGDELFFRLRVGEVEELGYVINLHELN